MATSVRYQTDTAENATQQTFQRLRLFNGIMGVLHLIQATIMVVISTDFAIPITTAFLNFNPEAPEGQRVFTDMQQVVDVQMGPVVASFLLLSAIAHFLIAGPFYNRYVDMLKQEVNFFRWYEYAVSSSVMIVALAMFVGMTNIPVLLVIFALNASMNFFGVSMESLNRYTETTNWRPFVFGCIAGIVPWIAIGLNLFGALSNATDTIPSWVIPAFISIFVFFNIFAVNMWLQYKEIGPWKNYIFGEAGYIVLSLVAKSALAWQVYSGTLAG